MFGAHITLYVDTTRKGSINVGEEIQESMQFFILRLRLPLIEKLV